MNDFYKCFFTFDIVTLQLVLSGLIDNIPTLNQDDGLVPIWIMASFNDAYMRGLHELIC